MISNLKSYLKIFLHTDDYNETKLIDDYDVGSSLSTAQTSFCFYFQSALFSAQHFFQPAFREQSIPKPCGADLKGQSGILLHMLRNGVRRKMVASSNKNKDLLV